jgi:hypothetical protein
LFSIGWLLSASMLAAETRAAPADGYISRPDPEGTPTAITLDLYLLQLKDIQTQEQQFRVDLVVTLSWRDVRLALSAADVDAAMRSMALTEIWDPQLSVVNTVTAHKLFPERALVRPDGTVIYRQRYQGTLATPFNLRDFPLDSQRLGLEAVAVDYSLSGVQFRIGETRLDPEALLDLAGWQFVSWTVEPSSRTFDEGVTAAAVTLQLTVKRYAHYYLWRSILPLLLIAMMASAIFWLNPEDYGPQLGLATGTVFTLIAFYLSLGRILPPLEYLTRMDRFVLGVTLMVFLSFAEAVLTARFVQAGRRALALRCDYWARLIHIVTLALLLVIAFVL